MTRVDLARLDTGLSTYLAQVNLAVAELTLAPPALPEGGERCAILRARFATLWHYPCASASRPPVLIVYALVNRPTMLDLDARHSLIRRLQEQGRPVYLVEWLEPGLAPGLDLATCVHAAIPELVQAACAHAQCERMAVLGVCQGGTLSLISAALHPERVAALVLLVTPVDFQTSADDLSRFASGYDFDGLAALAGSVPAPILDHVFLALKPFELRVQKYLHAHRLVARPGELAGFLRMEQWIFGGPAQSTALVRDFAKACYQDNALVHASLTVDGHPVRLDRLTVPVLNIYASADHLVPPAASRALAALVPQADYQEHVFAGGHIGIFVSQRAQDSIAARISAWLSERENITATP